MSIIEKSIRRLYGFLETVDPDLFVDDENKSQVAEACEIFLRRKTKVSTAPQVAELLGYPENSAQVYEAFVKFCASDPAEVVSDYAELRNKVAELLAETAVPSDRFEIVVK